MTAPRRVVLTIRNAAAHRTAFEAGALFARLFRAPLHGLFVDEPTLEKLCGLPAPFLPGGRRAAAPVPRRMMQIAAERAARRLSSELERMALRAQLTLTVSRHVCSVLEAVTTGAGTGDLLLLSADLSDRQALTDTLEMARAAARSCNVLIVPERAPRTSGAVLALAASPDDPAATMANLLAPGLGSHVLISAPRASSDEVRPVIPEGQHTRLVVADRTALEGVDLEDIIARERLSVLIMAERNDGAGESAAP